MGTFLITGDPFPHACWGNGSPVIRNVPIFSRGSAGCRRDYILAQVIEDRDTSSPRGVADGRSASRSELRRHLLTAPEAYLDGAIENPSLGDEEMPLLLRNRRAAPALLTRIGRDRRWTRNSEVRRLLVQHPQVPMAVARSLLSHLFWKDLLEVSVNLQVSPVIRRQTERMLQVRVEELSLGEKIALARRAPRRVILSLFHSDDPKVLRSVLGNLTLIEQDAVNIAGASKTSGDVLAYLALHPKWGVRRAVRQALIRNPRTPVPVALRLIGGLPRRDLQDLIRDAAVPKIVRVGAERRLEGRHVARG